MVKAAGYCLDKVACQYISNLVLGVLDDYSFSKGSCDSTSP